MSSIEPLRPARVMQTFAAALPLRTERLVLRLLSRADLEAVTSYRNLPETRRWMYSRPQTEAELMAWVAGGAPVILRDDDRVQLGIEAEGKLIGDLMVRIRSLGSRQVELGWALAPSAHGKGYATEAARAALGLAFELGAHRVVATLDEDNAASARVAERIGMLREARLVDAEVNPATGEFGTTVIYAIRRS